MYNTYRLRDHINILEDYIKLLDNYNIEFIKYTIIVNNINKRIYSIKDYLDIEYNKPIKDINSIFNKNKKFID